MFLPGNTSSGRISHLKKRSATIILLIAFLAGLSLLLYPTVSDYVNSLHQSRAISDYASMVADLKEEDYTAYINDAKDFNSRILERQNVYTLTSTERAQYESLLNIGGNGVMGYIEIPAIDASLPVYHGTSDRVLQVAVGHLDWTSLPVGGKSTHCVLSGHRGLPSAKLFTNLDKLVVGDVFMIRVLNEVLTYEVDQILIVEPQNTDPLQIEKGKDYCTLVTCTPYGINTHRLLVRGHRIENAKQASTIFITAEAIQIEPLLIASILGIVDILVLIIITFTKRGSEKRRSGKKKKNAEGGKASAKAGRSDNR